MSRDASRELPILTDVVELHATGSFPEAGAPPGARGALRLRACSRKKTLRRCSRCSSAAR